MRPVLGEARIANGPDPHRARPSSQGQRLVKATEKTKQKTAVPKTLKMTPQQSCIDAVSVRVRARSHAQPGLFRQLFRAPVRQTDGLCRQQGAAECDCRPGARSRVIFKSWGRERRSWLRGNVLDSLASPNHEIGRDQLAFRSCDGHHPVNIATLLDPSMGGSNGRWSRATARLSVKGAGGFSRSRFLPICLSV